MAIRSREKEYKEIFLAEAKEDYDAINRHLTELEKTPDDEKLLGEIFRMLHNLKANAKASGYADISRFAHTLENVFGAIRNKELTFTGKTVNVLFDAIDALELMLKYLDEPEKAEIDPRIEKNLDIILTTLKPEQVEESSVRHYHTAQNISLSDLIYIPIRKLDNLMNLVGELIIDRDRVLNISAGLRDTGLTAISAHLYRITSDIQQAVIDARLVNVGFLFYKFPRIVRDVASVENKQVELDIEGEDIQIDRNILQILTDSLLHLVRNAISHGIEPVQERKKANKPEHGHLVLSAQNDKDTVLIKVSDDGRGIDAGQVRKFALENNFISQDKSKSFNDREILALLFEPGFSLSSQITEYSGRGVGLDVVKNAIDSLGGRLSIDSEKGSGTTFSMYVPTSIAVKGALLFEVDTNAYAIPLIHTDAVVTLARDEIHRVGSNIVADIKGETMPLIELKSLFNHTDQLESFLYTYHNDSVPVIIVSYNNRRLGLVVDKLVRQQDIVVKPLQRPVDQIELFGGVTLLGNGEVCLVLDIPALSRTMNLKSSEAVAETL